MTSPFSLPTDADAWLADHPDLSPADLEAPWRLAEGANPLDRAPAPDPARIAQLQAGLEQAARPRPALRLAKGPSRVWPWIAAAACIALLVAVGLFVAQRPIVASAPYGERMAVDLPDGSRVELNSGSTLTYARRFRTAARRVTLEGEAFFDAATSETPFVIETFNASVTVLGTSFNVRAWSEDRDAQTVVSVVSGMVRVQPNAASSGVELTAGQTTRVADTHAVPSAPAVAGPDSVRIAWRSGGFFFDDQTFGAIFDEVERRFDVIITADASIRLQHRTFSKKKAGSADVFLHDFCMGAGLRYRATANGYEIYEE